MGLPLAPLPGTAWVPAGGEGSDLSVPLAGVMPRSPGRAPQRQPAPCLPLGLGPHAPAKAAGI